MHNIDWMSSSILDVTFLDVILNKYNCHFMLGYFQLVSFKYPHDGYDGYIQHVYNILNPIIHSVNREEHTTRWYRGHPAEGSRDRGISKFKMGTTGGQWPFTAGAKVHWNGGGKLTRRPIIVKLHEHVSHLWQWFGAILLQKALTD